MDDDFNTAAAIGHLYDGFVLANKLLDDPKAMPKPRAPGDAGRAPPRSGRRGAILGVMTRPPSEFLLARRGRLCARRKIDPAEIEARIANRVAARGARDFAARMRSERELKGRGVELMDTPAGTTWRVV